MQQPVYLPGVAGNYLIFQVMKPIIIVIVVAATIVSALRHSIKHISHSQKIHSPAAKEQKQEAGTLFHAVNVKLNGF